VVVHQPVAVIEDSDRENLLRGREPAIARWAEAGADIVMGGHIHLPYVLPLSGLARPLWAVQAGTAVSSRIRAGIPNSVNLLRWFPDARPRACEIEQWNYAADAGAFELAGATRIEPARDG
jgi:hypothetical protein